MNNLELIDDELNTIDKILDYKYGIDILVLIHSSIALTPRLQEMFLFGKDRYGVTLTDKNFILSSCDVAITIRICLLNLYGPMFPMIIAVDNFYTGDDLNNIIKAMQKVSMGISFLINKIRLDDISDIVFQKNSILQDEQGLEIEFAEYVLNHAIKKSEIMLKPFDINKIKIKNGENPKPIPFKTLEIDDNVDHLLSFFNILKQRIEQENKEQLDE